MVEEKDMRNIWIIIIIGCSMIILGVVLQVLDTMNRDRCYELPLNEFYNDNSCLKYFMELEEENA